MVKFSTSICNALLLSAFALSSLHAMPVLHKNTDLACFVLNQDTAKKDTMVIAKTDTIGQMVRSLQKFKYIKDTLNIRSSSIVPNLSLQQIIKGNLAGVYVQEPNGEPGTEQSMIIQGPSGVMFTKKDIYALQPAVYLNGVPLAQDNPFAFDVQKYDYNRIGPATNLLSQISIDNIQSIAVIKDPYELAKLGPNAANGAIYITTKNAKAGVRDISLNSYFGYVTPPTVNTVNGVYENNFRKPFYQKYATADNYASYASYLSDSTNTAYYGPSNWNDVYYQTSPTFSADLGITGGSDRANFRFFGSGTKNAGNADDTNINKYNLFFGINMAPFKWLAVSSVVNAARLDRFRNKGLRDRFAETRYIPDLTSPLSPNAAVYNGFLEESSKVVDNNRNTILNGSVTLSSKLNQLSLSSSLIFDYNEGSRDYFTPSTLMDGVSYISGYFGYTQRIGVNNNAGYTFDITKDSKINVEAGVNYQGDTYKYNYARGYNGPNDFVKINLVDGREKIDGVDNPLYLHEPNFLMFRYIDKAVNNLFSVYGSAKYNYKNLLTVSAIVRRDGSSNGQPDSRWVTTPALNANFNLKEQFLKQSNVFNTLNLSAGWGRTVRIFLDDKFAAGPQYRSENGWFEEPTIPGYNGRLGINRPYVSGFVGYGITLPYAERTNLTLDGSFLNDRLSVAITAYNRKDKNQVLGVSVPFETGYSIEYQSGMDVNNKGLELILNGDVLQTKKSLNWNTSLNLNYNTNKISALPNGMSEIVINTDKLVVGQPIGSYWLYTNQGIYNTDSEVPAGRTFNGIPMKAGDPKWVDYNGDNRIDDRDKVLTGNRTPKFVGGWNNTLSYKNFDINFNFIFALGQKAINQFESSRYGFINSESNNDINSIKEVSSWQIFDNAKTYPLYNPFSTVNAYRADQDLFLENASYLKMRSVTLGYDFGKAPIFKKVSSNLRRVYLYATAMNLFTLTKFSGVDPELINYNGIYDGANLTIPRTFVLGFKLDL